jgi:dihydroorotase
MEDSRYEKINNKYIYPGAVVMPSLQPSVNTQRREEQEKRRRILEEIQGTSMYLQNTLTCEMEDVLSLH